MATAIDDVTANPTFYGDMVSKCDDGFSGDVFLWLTEDDFRDFVFDSPASLIAQQILGQERINFFYDQLFVKQPGCYIRPELPRKDMGLPGYWAVLFVRAVMYSQPSAAPPLRTRPLLAPTSLEDLRRGRYRLHGIQNARHRE
jgi:hypothetical protein